MREYNQRKTFYEIFIALLALIVSAIVIIQSTLDLNEQTEILLNKIDFFIWIIFTLDYIINLILSSDKRKFIRTHKIDLISILPFMPILKSLRILDLLRVLQFGCLVRFTAFIYKFKERVAKFIFFDNFKNILFLTVIIILIGAGGITISEKIPFLDALWFSIVTSTTVGYGDIIPITPLGRTIASLMMLTGIGSVGILTASITLIILENNKRRKPYKEIVIDEVKQRLDDFDNLNKEDLFTIYKILAALKDKHDVT